MGRKPPSGRSSERYLDGYEARRDFRQTPEPGPFEPLPAKPYPPPPPAGSTGGPAAYPRFVVQEHHSRRLHWDLRLEVNGVLRSWAVPKGIPVRLGEKRLAVQVEDHPLGYLNFEGTIPPGNYGAGQVIIWDQGLYASAAMTPDKITFAVRGHRLGGAYKMVRTKDNQWLLFMLAPSDVPPLPGTSGGTPRPS